MPERLVPYGDRAAKKLDHLAETCFFTNRKSWEGSILNCPFFVKIERTKLFLRNINKMLCKKILLFSILRWIALPLIISFCKHCEASEEVVCFNT